MKKVYQKSIWGDALGLKYEPLLYLKFFKSTFVQSKTAFTRGPRPRVEFIFGIGQLF
jgi:hypothetical protein